MDYPLTRRNLEIAHFALRYAIADAVEELAKNNSPLNDGGRILLKKIDDAKLIIEAIFKALGNLEAKTDAEISR